ncbi:MAG: thiamine phosphate synthase [Dehalococcoidia bacterium]|nr:MAG: thiamine phosphate synthase [Dehalococcoidia bacterium]
MAAAEAMPKSTWRIIDANLNRIGEGLRLLEDLARLQLNDASLTEKLKTMRHDLIRGDQSFNQQLLEARDAEADVGVDIEVAGEGVRGLPTMIVANSRRVQQSLRVIEEIAKMAGGKFDGEKFKQARFALYTLEQVLLSRLLRRDKARRISGLYAIIDSQALKGRRHLEVASQIISGGAKVVQLRDKLLNRKELLALARQLRKLCAEQNVLFIVNDYLDIALACDADGLHLGQDDLPVKVARQLLPIDKMVGVSARSVRRARTAEEEGADYIAVGSIYPTTSKETAKVVGLERLRQVRQATSLPLVAIGGINEDNAADVIAAGANSVAMISALLEAESPQEAARKITARFEVSDEKAD